MVNSGYAPWRRRLLEAGAEHFARAGLERASVDAIAIAAGYAKGTFYNYFESKELIFASIVERGQAQMDVLLDEASRVVDPLERVRAALAELNEKLKGLPSGASGEDIQTLVYEVGKAHEFEPLRDWFRALYEVLLGQSQGPRFGNFVELYGVAETRGLIERVLKGGELGAG